MAQHPAAAVGRSVVREGADGRGARRGCRTRSRRARRREPEDSAADRLRRAARVVPLIVRARVQGAITFVKREGDASYTADEISLAVDLATRCALAQRG